MGIFRPITAAALGCALMLSAAPSAAQTRTIGNTPGPAEIPAASYAADTYVDSRGCVFIRAGIGGTTRWVPRVRRDRTVVCGQTPTAEAAVEAADPPVVVEEPVLRRRPAAAAARVAAATPPEPEIAAPEPLRPARAAAPRPPAPKVAAPVVATAPAIPARTVGGAVVVRVALPADARRIDPATPSPRRLGAPRVASRAAETVVVPVARQTFSVQTPPPGYRPAWTDGRINPDRGPRTLQGDYQTRGVWTTETPRRLRPVIRVTR